MLVGDVASALDNIAASEMLTSLFYATDHRLDSGTALSERLMVPAMPPQYLPAVRRFLSANSAPIQGSTARGGTMNIHFRTHGDVLRYTTANVVVTATWMLAIMVAAILLGLGTDLTVPVRTSEIVGFILVAAVAISALLSAILSYRSALLLRQISLMGSELALVSETDHLTGLLNRRGFDDAAVEALNSKGHVSVPATVLTDPAAK